ncbi:Hpt domain-containing protein [Qipengyuania sp. YG27]|uniref:Hpt domain-containing protein n=1 Tax=Qipengyuania mesophila TaxID=2867246 RepID=A0ABS7JYS0_9SPHN|nr:Hpt domain-containing protein [Qipengyuania mesophila]MBX7502804.1 Hpt domain-containing protein [Qipengyuania mesophila]
MAYHSIAFTAALASAAGDDLALRNELRAGFVDSTARQLDLLRRARCDANWEVAAERLHAIAASFHAVELMGLAAEARSGAPGDPSVIRRIEAFIDALD